MSQRSLTSERSVFALAVAERLQNPTFIFIDAGKEQTDEPDHYK